MRLESKKDVRVFLIAAVPLVLSILALTGWMLDIDLLKSSSVAHVYMNPLSAVLFVIISIYIISKYKQKTPKPALDTIFSILLITIVAFRLSDVYFNTRYNIDRSLFKTTITDNRMSPVAAINFVLIAITLAASESKYKILKKTGSACVIVSLFVCLIYVSGYVFNFLNNGQVWESHLSFNTGVAFFNLNLALLFVEKRSLTDFLQEEKPGSRLFRRISPIL